MLTVQAVYDMINARAPFETQDPYDNAGLLVGDPAAQVKGIHVAMDVTQRVLDEAEASGANLIITHHPLMFSPIKQLLSSNYEGRLIMRMVRSGMSLIAAHTNLDQAPGGVNDVLAQHIGLTNITGDHYFRVGDLPAPITGSELAERIAASLNTTVRAMGPTDQLISRVCVGSGGGSDSWRNALPNGAQAFLTGEMKHHHALEAADAGLLCLEAGHHATEEPGIFALADALQIELDAVKCKVHISTSQAGAYAPPEKP